MMKQGFKLSLVLCLLMNGAVQAESSTSTADNPPQINAVITTNTSSGATATPLNVIDDQRVTSEVTQQPQTHLPDSPNQPQAKKITASLPMPVPPTIAAKAYVLMDAFGQVLLEHAGHEPLPPASLTKLMTAYLATLAIKKGQVGEQDMITISENAWKTQGSRMFIQVGTQVSVSDLLHGIIIQSGNDASVAIAEHLAGSESAFAGMMNEQAKRLGMSKSHFMNATGLPHPEHYASPHDMAILAKTIINEDPRHYAIYSQKEFFWNNIKQPNRNLLLWRDSSVDGLKTGHTEEAGYCLVASAVRNNMRLIAAVFGTQSEKSRAEETEKLLSYGFRTFESKVLLKKDTEITKVPVWKGSDDDAIAGLFEDLTITVPKSQTQDIKTIATVAPELTAPIKQGQIIGRVVITSGQSVIATHDLVALKAVEEGNIFVWVWDSLRMMLAQWFS